MDSETGPAFKNIVHNYSLNVGGGDSALLIWASNKGSKVVLETVLTTEDFPRAQIKGAPLTEH